MAEYIARKTLSKLGYRFGTDDLSEVKASAFMIIAEENAKIDQEQLDKSSRG